MSNANQPSFFIGSSPSMAGRIINPEAPAAGVMVSVNALRPRKSGFQVEDWILDSGAFTEVTRHGGYRFEVREYYGQIQRWSGCGNLLAVVSQDWMCEAFALERTGLTIREHQSLTIERYDNLLALEPRITVIPVLQGYHPHDYLQHLIDYGDRLRPGAWVGVGSVCKRNGKPQEILNILTSIKILRPDLRLHGFGLKLLSAEQPRIAKLLYSCDSMAWSYPRRAAGDYEQNHQQLQLTLAHQYQNKMAAALAGNPNKTIPRTAGAGNGQGRKPKWKSKTKPIRVPQQYAQRLIDLAKQWEADET